MTIKDLQLRRNDLAAEIRKLADANESKFNAEQQANWEKVNADYDETCRLIDVRMRADKVHAETTAPANNTGGAGRGDIDPKATKNTDGGTERDSLNGDLIERDFQLALRGFVADKIDRESVTDEQRRACRRFGISPSSRELVLPLSKNEQTFRAKQQLFQRYNPRYAYLESRAQSTAIGSLGGYLVAPHFNSQIESAMLYYGPMLQVASPIRTSSGGIYPMPTDNETGATGAYTDQNTSNTTVDDISFGVVNFSSYKVTSTAVRVPYEAFRDMAIDLNTYLTDKLGERIGRFINTEATTGTSKCKGIITAATLGKTCASQTAIAMDEVLDLIHSIDLAYRNRPSVAFMFNDAILLALRKLKDGNGQYLWSNGTQASEPDLLWGKRYYINNDMASSIATTAKTILFGDLSKYFIRTVGTLRLTTTDQLYWASDQIGFQAYMEFDGNLVDAGTHPVKYMAQA